MIANITAGDTVSLITGVVPTRINAPGVHVSGRAIPMRIRGTAFQRTETGWLCSVGNQVYVATDVNVQAITKPNGEMIRKEM